MRFVKRSASVGRWFSGGEAWLHIADVVPALRPLGLIGRLPLARPVVDVAYRLIADNRHRISRLMGDDA
jgi:predicted DCC family thiol-disulfide oxidoreductase YuxK